MKNLIILIIILMCSLIMLQSCEEESRTYKLEELKSFSKGTRLFIKDPFGRYEALYIIENLPDKELMILCKDTLDYLLYSKEIYDYSRLIKLEIK